MESIILKSEAKDEANIGLGRNRLSCREMWFTRWEVLHGQGKSSCVLNIKIGERSEDVHMSCLRQQYTLHDSHSEDPYALRSSTKMDKRA